MRKLFNVSTLLFASVLAACGGGGGSAGDTKLPYSITLQANKTQLPINISNQPASIGANAPYTTTLYVQALEGSAPIPGGENIFACNVAGGLDSGALYYLDGKSEHQDTKGNPLAYRSITLGANAGGNSFHFNSSTKAGTARVTCTVTNPADKQLSSASVDIVVGAETGKPASVIATAQAPGYLGSRDNLSMIRNTVVIQAFLMDDANQPIPTPAGANLQVSIRQSSASAGAKLLSGSQSGSVVQVRTIGGVGEVSLVSGPNSGTIVLEFVTDRFDNNVSDGIQDPVVSLMAVGVYDTIAASTPLVITTTTVTAAQVGTPFVYALEATGGVPPYSWSAVGGLPSGLTLDTTGIIQGTPSAAGSFSVVVAVRDGVGVITSGNLTLTVAPAPTPPAPPAPTPPAQAPLAITGCGNAATVCQLPNASGSTSYVYAFSATGGDTSKPVTWIFTPSVPAPWLTTAQAGNNGVISGTPPTPANASECTVRFIATATRDTASESRQVSIKVTGGVCPP